MKQQNLLLLGLVILYSCNINISNTPTESRRWYRFDNFQFQAQLVMDSLVTNSTNMFYSEWRQKSDGIQVLNIIYKNASGNDTISHFLHFSGDTLQRLYDIDSCFLGLVDLDKYVSEDVHRMTNALANKKNGYIEKFEKIFIKALKEALEAREPYRVKKLSLSEDQYTSRWEICRTAYKCDTLKIESSFHLMYEKNR